MWYEIFSKIIPDSLKVKVPPSRPMSDVVRELSATDLNKIYVENVRSLLNTTTERAKQICDRAVEEGVFTVAYEIRCPDGSVALSVDDLTKVPEVVECTEFIDGDYESTEYPTKELIKQSYYRFA
jgi:hypothetical protein